MIPTSAGLEAGAVRAACEAYNAFELGSDVDHVRKIVGAYLAALIPPSRAGEAVAWRRMNKQRTQSTAVTDVKSFADQWAKAGDIVEPLYAVPQAVAPTGEVDRNTHLLDWLNDGHTHCQHGTKEWCEGYLHNARDVIKAQDAALTALSAKLAEAEKHLGCVADFVERHWKGSGLPLSSSWIIAELKASFEEKDHDLTASEAQATDLRRKLEEARKALAEASNHINRYADTAVEHDLIARIDAMISGGHNG